MSAQRSGSERLNVQAESFAKPATDNLVDAEMYRSRMFTGDVSGWRLLFGGLGIGSRHPANERGRCKSKGRVKGLTRSGTGQKRDTVQSGAHGHGNKVEAMPTPSEARLEQKQARRDRQMAEDQAWAAKKKREQEAEECVTVLLDAVRAFFQGRASLQFTANLTGGTTVRFVKDQ